MNNRGFTLIESVIALSLFLAATIAFGSLLRLGADTVKASARLTQAVYSIQTKMEEIRACPFEDLPALNGSTFSSGKGKTAIMPILVNMVRIELELKWDPKKMPLKIYTLRSDLN